ncbi:MAG: pyruvate kinase, partial [Bacillota bacterium]
MRKTKIICTIGPSSESEAMLRQLIENGMDVARLNFSHGDYESHGARIALIKRLRKEYGRPLAI